MRKAVVGLVLLGAALVVAVPCSRFLLAGVGLAATVEASTVLEEFEIGKGPRPILVPVVLNERTLLFMVDTGAWKTVVDLSLRADLGQPTGKTTVSTSAGLMEVEEFHCPRASVGRLELAGGTVACHDLTPLRYASGEDVYGVLGMDFLRDYAVEIDFDAGKFRIYQTAPAAWRDGKSMALAFDESNRPYVQGLLPSSKPQQFLIDTGSNTSTLEVSVFDGLFRDGFMTASTSHNATAAAGTFRGKTGYIGELKIGDYSHQNLRIDCDPFSALGLRYLARYKLQLDFPNGVAYFGQSSRFSIPEPTATSGISIIQVDDEKVVSAVEPGGPAASQFIQPGDVLLTVDGRPAGDCDMVHLHEILTRQPGASVQMQLRRNNQAFNVAVQLQSRLQNVK